MSENISQFIWEQTTFTTEVQEIVDAIYEAKQVFLYDTSAISSHELIFHRHQDLPFSQHIQGSPILITDTIARELRLADDIERRYLDYFSAFPRILYIEEEKLLDMLKVEYEVKKSKSKYLIASERSFASIQHLREQVREAKQHFSTAEHRVLSDYQSFFAEHRNANKGELSLLWTAAMIEQLPFKTNVCFVGLDHDLYDLVDRSYSSGKNSPFASDITFLSNDALLQSMYRKSKDQTALSQLMPHLRNENRKVRYFSRMNGLISHRMEKTTIENGEFLKLLIEEGIEVVY